MSRMFYIALAILVSAILLSLRMTVLLSVASVGIQLLFAVAAPSSNVVVNSEPLFFTLMIAPIVLIFTEHRAGLERERQAELQAANAALREAEASLEKRVTERTRDLQVAADVSRQITTILELRELLQAVVERTKVGFKLYHVSVFLYDAELQRLSLGAGAGKAGELMKAEDWRFNVSSDKGLVPQAARSRIAVLSGDVSAETHYAANPHRPLTRSELALPMVVGGKLVGVLDFQSEQVNRFSEDDVRVMTSLAEQIAIAVNNAHLYAEQVQVAERLRELDNMKSSFLASMSHELRTPLNGILNFSKFVSTGMLGPVNEKQVGALGKSIDCAKHLLNLINDVLDITKIESKMLSLFVESDVDLNEELGIVFATAETLLAGKPVTLARAIDPDLPLIIGDKRRIRQIMLNLVSNACKFTESGSITISAHVKDQNVLLSVKDTGPGITPEDQSLIFEAFRQTRVGLSQGGGTGLGLAIARRLAEAHGGRLWLESAPAKGATFHVELPIHSEMLKETIAQATVTGA